MRHFILILTLSIFILSCGQSDTKQKELELKENELALKQKELELKEKEVATTFDTTKLSTTSNQPVQSNADLNIPVAKVPLTKAVDVSKVHPQCNEANAPYIYTE